jgi:hypothetical protein
LRKLKFRLKREYLENSYFTFIKPILEYSSEVWDNCGQFNSDRLEKLQLEAARIVTGLTCYTSLDWIYREAGWEKLSTRREVKKLCMFYKLNVGNSPEFLCDLIHPSVGETNNYNLRNSHNIRDRPFNLKGGGLWFFVSFRIFFSDNTRVRIFFFVAQSAKYFSRFNIRLYDKNSESDYFFFLHQNQSIFFSNIGNQIIFFRKKPYPPPFQVKWSFP